MEHHDVVLHVLAVAIPIVCTFAVLLVLRFAAKLRWLTAICVAILVGLIFCTLGLQFYSGAPKIGLGPLGLLPAAVCAVILIIQFFGWLASGEDSTVNAAEREKILRMVEDAKISAEEGSELLDAMGRSTALRGQEKFSRLDFVTLIGAALVILGFFLPWVYIRMPKMLNSFSPQAPMSKSFSEEVPRPFVPGFLGNASVYQTGPNVGALGWVIFIIGILSAVPVFITPKDFLYKISMLQIFLTLIGLVLVISFLVRVGSNLGAGLIFCLAGFMVELFASAVKFKKLAA